ncbi:MAG: DUF4446 family protein [Nitriliruptoraceae bacterium]
MLPTPAPDVVALLAIIAVVVSLVAVAVCVALVRRLARVRRRLVTAFPEGTGDVLDLVAGQTEALRAIQQDQETIHHNTERLRERLESAFSRVGLVRYDAFDDVGGAQSFSLALLDRGSNGVVITSINGRSETRSYGKQIVGGESEHTLSVEERSAIDAAIEGRVGGPPLVGRRRRRSGP